MSAITTLIFYLSLWQATMATVLVLDTGSGFIKAGRSDGNQPEVIIRNVVGQSRYRMLGLSEQYGNEALRMGGVLDLVYPTESGLVVEWADQVDIWRHVIEDQLSVTPSVLPLVAAAGTGTTDYYDQLQTVLTDEFHPSDVHIVPDAVLALRSAGMETGLVIQSGFSVTSVTPVIHGAVLRDAARSMDIAGDAISQRLFRLLQESQESYVSMEHVALVKESICYVSQDYETELAAPESDVTVTYNNSAYAIQNVVIGRARFQAPEILFQPTLIGQTDPGLIQLAYETIMACEHLYRSELMANVFLAGGSTMFPGMAERIHRDLHALVRRSVQVHAPEDRQYAVWKGGAAMANEL